MRGGQGKFLVAKDGKATTLGCALKDTTRKGIDKEKKGQDGYIEDGNFTPIASEIGKQASFASGAK